MAKKSIAVVLILLFAFCAGLSVLAEDNNVEVIADIPAWVSVTINMSGGSVLINGAEYHDGDLVMIPYNSPVTMKFIPSPGMVLESIVLNGEDIIGMIVDGKYTASGFRVDSSLSVVQKTAPVEPEDNTPNTGDNSDITIGMLLCGAALILLITAPLIGGGYKKHSAF